MGLNERIPDAEKNVKRLVLIAASIIATGIFALDIVHYADLSRGISPAPWQRWVEREEAWILIGVSILLAGSWAHYILVESRHEHGNPTVGVESPRLHIYYAHWRYGTMPWQKWDVTEMVRAASNNNSVDMPVSINRFGDPRHGRVKTLIVRYSYAGLSPRRISLPEEREHAPSNLILPEVKLRKKLEEMLKDFPADKT
jgi:hypothetical protein